MNGFFYKMKKLNVLFIAMFFCTQGRSYSENSKSQLDSILFFSQDMLAYLNNLEYYNSYREGEPFWGAYLQLRLSYKPFKKTTFSAGIHVRKDIGDESFLSDARPLFRAHYLNKRFSFVLGELFCKKRHGLLDALLKEQVIYNPVVEEGIQILYNGDIIKQDFWANYPALNTAEHREHLCAGNSTFITLNPFCFSLMAYISHYGGQLFAPKDDPVRENLTGTAGISYRLELKKKLEEVGFEQFFIGSYTADDRSEHYYSGLGSISRAWLVFFGFECSILFFKGNNYTTWEGNPMYQANSPYYYFEIAKSVSFTKDVFFNFGLRLDFMGISPADYFENGDNQIWFNLGYTLKKVI